MIVKGRLKALGSSTTNSLTGFRAYKTIEFDDGTEILISHARNIAVPIYIADKLERELDNDIELSMSENKFLVLALKTNANIYRIEKVHGWMRTLVRGGVFHPIFLIGYLSILCFPLLLVWVPLRISETKKIQALAEALN